MRLPKARDEQAMTLDATLGVLAAAGRLILYGGNDEGIRSAARMLEQLCGGIETMAARGHGRMLAARSPQRTDELKGALAHWRRCRVWRSPAPRASG